MQNQQNNLTQLLQNPQYRKQYVKYKVRVEHRGIPYKLLRALPYNLAAEIQKQWEKELYEYLKQKRHEKTKNTLGDQQ